MERLSDEQLVKLANSGDDSSLDFLLKKYKRMANKIARSYFLIGSDYDDLLQEAMIGLYKAIKSYKETEKASFKTFAYLCITRNVQSAVKSAHSKKNAILTDAISLSSVSKNEDNDEIDLIIPSTVLSPEKELIENENYQEVKEIITNTLSKFEQKVLKLFLLGESYEQISKTLNITYKSVDNALSRIRSKLSFLKK